MSWNLKIFILVSVSIEVLTAIHIINLKVPPTYVIEPSKPPPPLILDCEYEHDRNESNIVVKWSHNNTPIYQWIPNAPKPNLPRALNYMKNHINTTYEASPHSLFKYRALYIVNPTWRLTGEYTCAVQSFQSGETKSAYMQVIVEESDFNLSYNATADGNIYVNCSTKNIYPVPKLQITLNSDERLQTQMYQVAHENGLFDVSALAMVSKHEIVSPAQINCVLSVSRTNYVKKKETIYYDVSSLPTSIPKRMDVPNSMFEYGNQIGSTGSRHLLLLLSPKYQSYFFLLIISNYMLTIQLFTKI